VGVALLALFFAAGLILVALWTALPIAVFGVRSILRDLLETQRETNQHLDALRRSEHRVAVAHTIRIERNVAKLKLVLSDRFRPKRLSRVIVPVSLLKREGNLD
jgi:hypothetical protein